jgi:hypothetical protein
MENAVFFLPSETVVLRKVEHALIRRRVNER